MTAASLVRIIVDRRARARRSSAIVIAEVQVATAEIEIHRSSAACYRWERKRKSRALSFSVARERIACGKGKKNNEADEDDGSGGGNGGPRIVGDAQTTTTTTTSRSCKSPRRFLVAAVKHGIVICAAKREKVSNGSAVKPTTERAFVAADPSMLASRGPLALPGTRGGCSITDAFQCRRRAFSARKIIGKTRKCGRFFRAIGPEEGRIRRRSLRGSFRHPIVRGQLSG